MQPDDLLATTVLFWVLFALTCSVFFLFLRFRLGQKRRRYGYPYAVYTYRKRRLRRRYLYTLGYSIVLAVSVVGLWRLSN